MEEAGLLFFKGVWVWTLGGEERGLLRIGMLGEGFSFFRLIA